MRKPTKKTLTNKLDRAFSKLIRSRGECERCGCGDYSKLQCAHIYSRKYKSIRWYWKNALCLCAGCHFWGHHNPLDFAEFVRDRLGEDNYKHLIELRNEPKKWTPLDMQEALKELDEALTYQLEPITKE